MWLARPNGGRQRAAYEHWAPKKNNKRPRACCLFQGPLLPMSESIDTVALGKALPPCCFMPARQANSGLDISSRFGREAFAGAVVFDSLYSSRLSLPLPLRVGNASLLVAWQPNKPSIVHTVVPPTPLSRCWWTVRCAALPVKSRFACRPAAKPCRWTYRQLRRIIVVLPLRPSLLQAQHPSLRPLPVSHPLRSTCRIPTVHRPERPRARAPPVA